MKIHRPTAAALAGFVLIIVSLAAWGHHLGMSADALSWVQGAAALIGGIVLAALPKLLADKDGDGVPDILKPPAGPVALLLCAIAIPATTSGCGAGALRAHARASSVLVVAIQGADELADTGAEIALAGCADAACEDHVVEVTEAIDAGIAAAMLPVGAYVQSVEMALAGGDDVDVLSALFSVLARALAAWDDLVPLFAPLGVELPPLPASVRALVDLLAPSGAAS